MALSGPDNWGVFRKKPRGLMGFNDPRSRSVYSSAPRTPFSSYEAAHSRSDMVAPRVAPTKKGFFGNMSPEELKDFKETLAEMDFGVDQEFLAGGNFGRTQEYGALPYSFDESSMAEMQKRKKLFPFLA